MINTKLRQRCFRGLQRVLKPRSYRSYHEIRQKLDFGDPDTLSRDYLKRLLIFARNETAYYSSLLGESDKFERVPILTKALIRKNRSDLTSTRSPDNQYRNSSGGSTGRPITLLQDAHYKAWTETTKDHYFREFLKVERNGVRSVWLWGSDRDLAPLASWRQKAVLFLNGRIMLNTFYAANDEDWLSYAATIQSYQPCYVAGYASSLYQLALVARKHHVRLYQPTFIHSSAEMLHDFMREQIEVQFGAKVYDFYGSREVGAIAGECLAGRKHVFTMNNMVEVMNEDREPVSGTQEGSIIVTNLHNYSMPLIRYEIGDTGVLSSEHCPCGSSLPVLEKLSGRTSDHFRLRDGGIVHGEFFTHLFYYREWVERFQIDQTDYDHIIISVVLASAASSGEMAEIGAKIGAVMGQDCSLEWQFPDSIEKTSQGKHLFTRCLVD